ncbi:MAG: 2-dehydro-3-deoxyglucarate aldolase [Sediminibacterium sp.]|nr:2-dehydro-3-deoxyglucarate aldolase [Sediminibacterium sp.]
MKNIKTRIKNGEAVNGGWLNLGSAVTAEIVSSAGFDWVLIDLEHGAGDEQQVLSQLQAIEHSNAAAFVRVENNGRQRIHRVLDFGAEGIMCPHINNETEANEMVTGLRYPPHGSRGVAKMVRATQFGKQFADYYQNANETIVGLAQIESKEALNHLDAIAGVDGIDVLFIGPADLTMDLGIFGEFDNPIFINAVKAIVIAAQKANKATGILIFNPEDYQKYFNLGIRVIACGSDSGFVVEGSKNTAGKLDAMRKSLAK